MIYLLFQLELVSGLIEFMVGVKNTMCKKCCAVEQDEHDKDDGEKTIKQRTNLRKLIEQAKKEDPKRYRDFMNRVTHITWDAIERIQIEKNAKFQLKEFLQNNQDFALFKHALRDWIVPKDKPLEWFDYSKNENKRQD